MEDINYNRNDSNLKGSLVLIVALHMVIGIYEIPKDPVIGILYVALGVTCLYQGIYWIEAGSIELPVFWFFALKIKDLIYGERITF